MIPKSLDDITETDLINLIDNSVAEGRTIEYKQELLGNSDADKKEFLADISSFANAIGGDLVYGIVEDNSLPIAVEGLEIEDIDKEILRLEEIIRTGIKPRIPSLFTKQVNLSNSKSVIIIRINKSWISPHRVVFKGHDKFYSRSSKGKYPLDVDELRIAFNLSETTSERIRKFRESRIANIVAGENPVPFYDEDLPVVMLHLIPFSSFNPAQSYDMSKIDACSSYLTPISPLNELNKRYNFDGRVDYGYYGEHGKTDTYVQIFKTGIVEAVWKHPPIRSTNEKILDGDYIEKELNKAVSEYLKFLKKLDVGLPIFIFLSIIGVKGYSIPVTNVYKLLNRVYSIDRDILIIPEIIIDNYDIRVSDILKPCFDSMWNAAGFRGSPNYSPEGEWKPRNI